jgi:3,4-dihydroxy 2-butanone 4-phosphate synthase/GTP cyclohydrolase II
MISPMATTEEIIAELAQGNMVVLVDEEDRENEGDLVLAADHVTPQAINFMASQGRGLICLTLTTEHCERLRLAPMTTNNNTVYSTAFTVSIEAAQGVTTGISAADRAHTITTAVAPNVKPEDLVQPGHVFPLRAVTGGVLMRAGHTEAGCDLARLADCTPASVICEIMKDDGTMARLPDLQNFAKKHHLKIGTIADLIAYRSRTESLIKQINQQDVATPFGDFVMHAFEDLTTGNIHLALVKGAWGASECVVVRVHEPFSVLDILCSHPSYHSWNLDTSLSYIQQQGRGVAVLLNCAQEPKHLRHTLQKKPESETQFTPQSERIAALGLRTYGIGAQILRYLGVRKMELLSPVRKMPSLVGYDLEVVGFKQGIKEDGDQKEKRKTSRA